MINLNKGENDVILTLTESFTNSGYSPIFLLENTGEKLYFSATDTSLYTNRYNQYNWIINSGSTDLTGGTFDIDIPGLWDYKVYEKEGDIILSDLSASGITNLTIIERGKCRVNTRVEDKVYKDNTISKKIYYK